MELSQAENKTQDINKDNRLPVAVILGPTATGKSWCAIQVAKRLNGEIISGDSALVYRGLDIGTAKPAATELAEVPHHLVNILEPQESFNVMDFQQQAARLIREIRGRGRLPIIAGGTGLYIKALLEGYSFSTAVEDSGLRRELERQAQQDGASRLYERLQRLDPAAAQQIHPNNIRRVIRALEAVLQGGSVSRQRQAQLVYDAAVFGLTMPRELLYERIDRRVEQMLAAGLAAEVRSLLGRGVPPDCQAMQSIGYRQMVWYLQQGMAYEEAVAKLKQATRNFAKRQITWYKKMPYIEWFNIERPDEQSAYEKIVATISAKLAGKCASV